MNKPFVGQLVEYRYKPETSAPPLAAIVTQLHGERDGSHWVALHVFSETSRWVPHVEFNHHCKPAAPAKEPDGSLPAGNTPMTGFPFGIFP